jgi:hypothetical protein
MVGWGRGGPGRRWGEEKANTHVGLLFPMKGACSDQGCLCDCLELLQLSPQDFSLGTVAGPTVAQPARLGTGEAVGRQRWSRDLGRNFLC